MRLTATLLFFSFFGMLNASCTYQFHNDFVQAGEVYKQGVLGCRAGSTLSNSRCEEEQQVALSHDVNTAIINYNACLANNP